MGTGLAAKYEIIQSITKLSSKIHETILPNARSLCDDHQPLKEFNVIFYHFQAFCTKAKSSLVNFENSVPIWRTKNSAKIREKPQF